jgi:hypothetical protein
MLEVGPRDHLQPSTVREARPVNEYGTAALEHWRRWRPQQFATIQDPEEFFSTLGATVAAQVDQLTDDLAGPDSPGESYLDKVGRLGAARRQAEEMVTADLVYLPAESEADEQDEDPTGDPLEQIRIQAFDRDTQRRRQDRSDLDWQAERHWRQTRSQP